MNRCAAYEDHSFPLVRPYFLKPLLLRGDGVRWGGGGRLSLAMIMWVGLVKVCGEWRFYHLKWRITS